VDRLPQKIDATGFALRKYGSSRKRTACTSENIDAVEELVFSLEDASAPETHGTVRHFEQK